MIDSVVDKNGKTELEKKVAETLHLLGVPVHVKGFRYLKDAIIMAIYDFSAADLITKRIYPAIAETYHTTPYGVERAMRHALQITWERGPDGPVANKIFPIRLSKPKNCEFICEVASYITRAFNVERSSYGLSELGGVPFNRF